MPIYMNWDSLAITGTVTDANHKTWIDVSSIQWGLGRGIITKPGVVGNREGSTPNISEMVITKVQDPSLIGLLTQALTDKLGKTVIFDFCTTGTDSVTYLQYTLTNALISGYSFSSGGDRPSESISLNFTKIEVKDVPADATGKDASQLVVTYDLVTAATV